ncbi:hypothetical protein BDZ89DRAFT_816184 [Hymenopellis radicata]|nr:hypothetical protein BDZ89DRAFT_816184 [Hymenopellis radicata]
MENIESTPQPAVKNLLSRFEQLAVETSPPPSLSKRPPSRNSFLEPGSPRQRATSGTFPPNDIHHIRTSSSASDLKGLKRPPPPPPNKVSRPPSPSPSPLRRPVPLPSTSSPSGSHTPRVPNISLIDADIEESEKGVAALRSKFMEPSSGHTTSSSDVEPISASLRPNYQTPETSFK